MVPSDDAPGPAPLPKAVALDLDGVVWREAAVIPGAPGAIAALRAAGVPVVFVTNNAFPAVVDHEVKLAAMGVPADGDVVTSPMGAASLLRRGERVLVAGGPGIAEAVLAAGATPLSYAEVDAAGARPVDAVVAGFHRDFDWERMRIASDAIRRGARFIATNDDATYPTEDGEVPGGGAIIAGIAVAAGVAPVIAGKPHEPVANVVRARCGDEGLVVGDRPSTDGGFARTLGWRFALVLSGVTAAADLPVDPAPDMVGVDLADVVAQVLAAAGAASAKGRPGAPQ
jgi:HAD superfamily hydrolase (TIGR01450 family)